MYNFDGIYYKVIPIDATGMGVRVLYLCNDKKQSTNERDQTENTIIREQQIDKEEDGWKNISNVLKIFDFLRNNCDCCIP